MDQSERILEQRELASSSIVGKKAMLLACVGQCSTHVRDLHITRAEALKNQVHMHRNPNEFILQRHNHWKPRSPRTDGTVPWEGIDVSHPAEALQFHTESVAAGIASCMELALPRHIDRYASGLIMGWVGSRNRDSQWILETVMAEGALPLGIKGDLTGDLEWALTIATTGNHLRDFTGGSAPVFAIDRGGTLFNTPRKWEDNVKRNLERTSGVMALDLAHGSEQAHDPDGNFGKSVEGQIRAMEHYITIGEQTGMWANALLLEASDAPSDTDPNMPHSIALDGIAHVSRLMYPDEKITTVPRIDSESAD